MTDSELAGLAGWRGSAKRTPERFFSLELPREIALPLAALIAGVAMPGPSAEPAAAKQACVVLRRDKDERMEPSA